MMWNWTEVPLTTEASLELRTPDGQVQAIHLETSASTRVHETTEQDSGWITAANTGAVHISVEFRYEYKDADIEVDGYDGVGTLAPGEARRWLTRPGDVVHATARPEMVAVTNEWYDGLVDATKHGDKGRFGERLWIEYLAAKGISHSEVIEEAGRTYDLEVAVKGIPTAWEIKTVYGDKSVEKGLRKKGLWAGTTSNVAKNTDRDRESGQEQLKVANRCGVPTVLALVQQDSTDPFALDDSRIAALLYGDPMAKTDGKSARVVGHSNDTTKKFMGISAIAVLKASNPAVPCEERGVTTTDILRHKDTLLSARIYHNRNARTRLEPDDVTRAGIVQYQWKEQPDEQAHTSALPVAKDSIYPLINDESVWDASPHPDDGLITTQRRTRRKEAAEAFTHHLNEGAAKAAAESELAATKDGEYTVPITRRTSVVWTDQKKSGRTRLRDIWITPNDQATLKKCGTRIVDVLNGLETEVGETLTDDEKTSVIYAARRIRELHHLNWLERKLLNDERAKGLICQTPERSWGKPTIQTTRISVVDVLELMAGTESTEEVRTDLRIGTQAMEAAIGYAAAVIEADEERLRQPPREME